MSGGKKNRFESWFRPKNKQKAMNVRQRAKIRYKKKFDTFDTIGETIVQTFSDDARSVFAHTRIFWKKPIAKWTIAAFLVGDRVPRRGGRPAAVGFDAFEVMYTDRRFDSGFVRLCKRGGANRRDRPLAMVILDGIDYSHDHAVGAFAYVLQVGVARPHLEHLAAHHLRVWRYHRCGRGCAPGGRAPAPTDATTADSLSHLSDLRDRTDRTDSHERRSVLPPLCAQRLPRVAIIARKDGFLVLHQENESFSNTNLTVHVWSLKVLILYRLFPQLVDNYKENLSHRPIFDLIYVIFNQNVNILKL